MFNGPLATISITYQAVIERGHSLDHSDDSGIKWLREEDGKQVFHVESGSYDFAVLDLNSGLTLGDA